MTLCVDAASKYFTPEHHHGDRSLEMDQARVTFSSHIDHNVMLCAQSSVCHNCSLLRIGNISARQNKTFLVYTAHPATFKLFAGENYSTTECSIQDLELSEYGHYNLHINPTGNASVNCNLIKPTTNDSNIPLYVMLSALFGLAIIWILVTKLISRYGWCRFPVFMNTERLINSDLGTPAPVASEETTTEDADSMDPSLSTPSSPPPKKRLRSLDTFRGLSLVLMIFVNYGGGGYWFLHHSAWDGLTVADLVFPWFVFIMGTSMSIAFRSLLRRRVTRGNILWKVIKRALILYVLGLLVSNKKKHGHKSDLDTLRIPGVLQRLAVIYLIVGLMEVIFAQAHDLHQHKWWAGVRDVLPFWPQWLVAAFLVAAHSALSFLLTVPGCPKGYLGPGGLADQSEHFNCTGGAAGYLERLLFGDAHIYQHPTTLNSYLTTQPYDPEGLTLGSLSSAFLCFLGLQAGKTLLIHQDWKQRCVRWMIWSIIVGSIAGTLCKFSQYDGWIPLNKNLWSLSFVLALGSMAFFLLTVCYIVIDVYGLWSGAPFYYPGMNSIVIYLGHEILEVFFPVQFSVANTHAAQLAMCVWGTSLWVIVAIWMFHKDIFIAI